MTAKHCINTLQARCILWHTSYALIWEYIHYTYKELDKSIHYLLETHLSLAVILKTNNWDLVDSKGTAQGHVTLIKASSKCKEKFNHIHKTQFTSSKADFDKEIVNTSETAGSNAYTLTNKGLNFAVI
jgi:hypothetical protein